jgi:hypothetical protein
MFQRTVQSMHWAHDGEQITYLGQLLDVSNMLMWIPGQNTAIRPVSRAGWSRHDMACYETDCLEMWRHQVKLSRGAAPAGRVGDANTKGKVYLTMGT